MKTLFVIIIIALIANLILKSLRGVESIKVLPQLFSPGQSETIIPPQWPELKPFTHYEPIKTLQFVGVSGVESGDNKEILPSYKSITEIPTEEWSPSLSTELLNTLRLTGIIEIGGLPQAILENSVTKEGYYVKIGDTIMIIGTELTVIEIEQEEIVFNTKDGQRYEVKMMFNQKEAEARGIIGGKITGKVIKQDTPEAFKTKKGGEEEWDLALEAWNE